jgi:hypothetical protein
MTTVDDKTKKKHSPAVAPGTTTKPQGGAPPQGEKAPELKATVQFIKLADIAVDPTWNSRSPANVASEAIGDSGGLEELATSMRTNGQDIAVTVRANIHKKGAYRDGSREKVIPPWELATGFRRFAAAVALNKSEWVAHCAKLGRTVIPNVPNGAILAEASNLDDLRAKLLNGRENISRNQLEPPDALAHFLCLVRPPFSMTVQEISDDQGVGLGTVHRYTKIGQSLDPKILEHYRFGGVFAGVAAAKRATIEEVEAVSSLPLADQPAAYKGLLGAKRADEEKKSWFASAEKKASRVGELLARMEKAGVVSLTGKPWGECLPALMAVPRGAGPIATEKLAEAVAEGYLKEKQKDETRRVKP